MGIEGHNSGGYLELWKRVAIAALWPVSSLLMGFLAATLSGEHGSIVFVVVGLYVGVPGAIGYLLLPLLSLFRRLGVGGRIAAYTVVAILPTVACSAYAALSNSQLKASFVLLMSGIATGFACICALLATQVESRWLA
jgi:hypothetical protein